MIQLKYHVSLLPLHTMDPNTGKLRKVTIKALSPPKKKTFRTPHSV